MIRELDLQCVNEVAGCRRNLVLPAKCTETERAESHGAARIICSAARL